MFSIDKRVSEALKAKDGIKVVDNISQSAGVSVIETNGGQSKDGQIEIRTDENIWPKFYEAYAEITRNNWENIPIGSYLRYINDEGVLKTGAKLKEIIKTPDNEIIFTFYKYVRGRPGYKWSISSNKIQKVFKYRKMEERTPRSTDTKTSENNTVSNNTDLLNNLGNKLLFEDNDTLIKKIEAFEVRLQTIEAEVQKLVSIIKQAYEKRRRN